MLRQIRHHTFPAIFGIAAFAFVALWAYATTTTVNITSTVSPTVSGHDVDIFSTHDFGVNTDGNVSGTAYMKHWVPDYIVRTRSESISQGPGYVLWGWSLSSYDDWLPSGSYTAKSEASTTIGGTPGHDEEPFTIQ